MVCSKSSRVSTYRAYANRVVNNGTAKRAVAHQPTPLGSWNTWAMSHANGTSPSKLMATPPISCAQTVRKAEPVLALTAARASVQLTDTNAAPATSAAMNEPHVGSADVAPVRVLAVNSKTTPAATPEMANRAWLKTVPYHGTRPRS